MKTQRRFDHSGSTFDSFLEEQGLLQKSEAVAVKRIIAWKLSEAMASAHVTKKAMAERLRTSRAQVDRLLDPANIGVSLGSVAKAARALGKRISVQIVDVRPVRNRRRSRRSAA